MPVIDRDQLPAAGIAMLDHLAAAHQHYNATWLTRSQLAEMKGKKLLNPAEMTHLEYLRVLSFIEIQRPDGQVAYKYRLINGAHKAPPEDADGAE